MKPLLALAFVLAAAGCSISEDEEMRPRPTHTVTGTQSALPRRAVPARVPVPGADAPPIGPGTRPWVRGSVLHVADREVDVAPLRVDAWVVVPGGIYFLDGDKLWLTDLSRVRDTGLDDVERLETTPDGSRVVVRFGGPGRPTAYAFDTRSGDRVAPGGLDTLPARRPGPGVGSTQR